MTYPSSADKSVLQDSKEFPAESVPDSMASRDQWLVARRNPSDTNRDKVPLKPGNPTAVEQGLSLETALRLYQNPEQSKEVSKRFWTGEAPAIGFILSPDDSFLLIDWDDVRNPIRGDQSIPQLVQDEVTRIGGYVEVSTSGTGLHQIVRVNAETEQVIDGRKSKGELPLDPVAGLDAEPHVEAYHFDRYAVMTGVVWTHPATRESYDSIKTRSERAATLAREYLPARGERRTSETSTSPSSDTRQTSSTGSGDICSIGREQAQKHQRPSGSWIDIDVPTVDQAIATGFALADDDFNKLWNRNTSGYPTQSEADCALISKLWYYCGDRRLVDRAFRQSSLMRDKWEQDSYREATLAYTRDNDRHEGQYLDPSQ
jgi:primase-polymerase (primpol)-like protein